MGEAISIEIVVEDYISVKNIKLFECLFFFNFILFLNFT